VAFARNAVDGTMKSANYSINHSSDMFHDPPIEPGSPSQRLPARRNQEKSEWLFSGIIVTTVSFMVP
jgi:hypothetical protein